MRIGEVARLSGVSVRMLRHYDAAGLVRPGGRTAAGYRDYTQADVRRLLRVEALRSLGLSLAEARRALDDPAAGPDAVLDKLIAATRQRIADGTALLGRLEELRDAGAADWTEALEVVALLRGMRSAGGGHRLRAALDHGSGGAGPAATVLARALLEEPDPNVAGALRWALARSGGGAAALAEALADPDRHVRLRAVEGLAELRGGEETGPALRVALSDADGGVRARAALELGAAGDAAAADELVRMVLGGRSDVAAAEALRGLICAGAAPAGPVIATLGSAARDAAEPAAALRAVQALAEIGGAGAHAALARAAAEGEGRPAATAAALRARI